MAHAALVHDQHDDTGWAPADLETEAAAFHPNGCGRTPTCMILTANRISAAPFRADAKRRLLHPRHDDDAVCLLQQILRDSLIRNGHDLVENAGSVRQPLLCG